MNFIQGALQQLEVGKASILIRLVPLMVTVGAIIILSDFSGIQTPIITLGGTFHGLNDAQSMDNAQLARQIVRGQGYTTKFLRPHAIAQLRDFAVSQSLQTGKPRELFPSDKFPPGTPRVLPDTYNAPGYPYLLAGWFFLTHPEFGEPSAAIRDGGVYAPERCIPFLNQIFFLLTAVLVFLLGRRLFDQRVAWMGLVSFLVTDLIWKYSLTALPTSFLMFLVTAAFYCLQEIFSIGEDCFASEERSFAPAWGWAVLLIFFLVVINLTSLPMLALIVPVAAMLLIMPSSSIAMGVLVPLVVLGAAMPWYFHLSEISGSYLGSNAPQVLHGLGDYEGNQIFCTTAIPSYEQLFREAVRKEYQGFRWNFEHAWSMLGSNPMILLFGVSILHQFKRRRTRLFHWLIYSSVIAMLLANNLGVDNPQMIDSWNVLVLLFPCMVIVGSAFFFILLDRLSLQLWLLNNLIVIATLLLAAMPLAMTLTTATGIPFSFPPYFPPAIKDLSQFAQPDEWVTTDMPWATAWYGDRASLWMPDTLGDFENFHDNVCPTGLILITPVSGELPLKNITTGEYKDWFGIVTGIGAPQNFPLPEHFTTQGKNAYTLWSDKPRWQAK